MRQKNVGFVANGDTLLSLRQSATFGCDSLSQIFGKLVLFCDRQRHTPLGVSQVSQTMRSNFGAGKRRREEQVFIT
jgi:hypothetical protein